MASEIVEPIGRGGGSLNEKDIWSIAYHLSGTTLLGKTQEEPLGPLPYPVRSAVLRVAKGREPSVIATEPVSAQLDYAGGKYDFIEGWSFLNKDVEARLTSRRPSQLAAFSTIEDYFKHHDLRRRQPDGTDEHYAERLFVEKSFVPVFGLHGLRYLTPQFPFVDSEGKRRRIDFVLHGRKDYALEVEGRTHHSREALEREDFEDEKVRQAQLGTHGYTYVPFTLSSIEGSNAKELLNELSVEDDVLMRLARAERQRLEGSGSNTKDPTGLRELELMLCAMPDKYQTYQQLAFALLYAAEQGGTNTLDVCDFKPELPLFSIAMLDTVALIERVSKLYGLRVSLPSVNLHVVGGTNAELHDAILNDYLCVNSNNASARVDASKTAVNIAHVPELPKLHFDYISSGEAISQAGAPSGARGYEEIKRYVAPFLQIAGLVPPAHLKPVHFDRQVLDYFARRFSPYAELKPEQVQLIQRSPAGESVLGILPTGFGKSAVFQIFALLSPRVTLVISPLKSLMRDQIYALRRRGLIAVNAITSSSTPSERTAALQGFSDARYKMLYVSPERLQIKAFVDELRASIENTPVGALVIDEAHCISEWGHDFRPAYLQIAPTRQALQDASKREIPLIALTATASHVVREDIVGILGLEPESVIQLSSSDRPNLSLSVHPVPPDSTFSAKDELISDLIQRQLPRTLGIPADELIPIGSDPPYEHAGVVFSIYANPHGNTTIGEGVHAIAANLAKRVTFDPGLVQVHASSTPAVCPQCESPLFVRASRAKIEELHGDCDGLDLRNIRYICLNPECAHVFHDPNYLPEWDDMIAERQDAFSANEFPFLVATKGYGMGVDKRNIRFVIHHALSAGFESYYQEAGRAGRDKRHSHVALVFRPPTTDCNDTYLRKNSAPPCVTDKHALQFHRCPMGLKGLCDAGRQAHFIASNYAGVESDLQTVISVYDKICSGVELEARGDDENKQVQLALFRLQQMGLIRSYTLEYKWKTRVVFEIDLEPEFSLDHAAGKLRNFLKKTRASDKEVSTKIGRLLETSIVSEELGLGKEFVSACASILLERVYAEIPRMRYDMLRNLLRYSESKTCRRIHIRAVFDKAPPGDDYKCGFCDVCNPDLDFDRDNAEVPIVDAQIDDITKRLPEIYEQFNLVELPAIVETVVGKGAVQGMYHRVSNALEHDGTNVAALYLAGALGSRQPELRFDAMENLRFGVEELRRQGKGRPEIMLIYLEGKQVDGREAFSWLDASIEQFGDREGLKVLEEEAVRELGSESDEARTIQGLRQVRALTSVQSDLDGLAASISKLAGGLSDMPEIRV